MQDSVLGGYSEDNFMQATLNLTIVNNFKFFHQKASILLLVSSEKSFLIYYNTLSFSCSLIIKMKLLMDVMVFHIYRICDVPGCA